MLLFQLHVYLIRHVSAAVNSFGEHGSTTRIQICPNFSNEDRRVAYHCHLVSKIKLFKDGNKDFIKKDM